MADLLAILSNGSASLLAHRAAASTAGHNLQNANTPGYARQRAELEATRPAHFQGDAYLGRGVRLGAVTQARDRFLERQIPAALTAESRSRAESDALEAVNALGPEEAGVSSALADFYSSLRALSQNAGDSSLRQAAVGAARSLALTFNGAARAVEGARAGLDAQLEGIAQEANLAAADVARLNQEIAIARAAGAEPNDLLDARQRAMDTLAELVGASPVPAGAGHINMVLPGGTALVAGIRAGTLAATPDPTNGGHLALTLRPPGGGPAVALRPAAVGGRAAGVTDARDGSLAAALGALDGLAFELAGELNAAHRAGFGLDGGTGRDLFDAGATAAGAALRIAVHGGVAGNPDLLAAAATAAELPGDSTALFALLATESAALPSGLPPGAALARMVSGFGAAAARARAIAEQDRGIREHLETLRESVSGVSIDEEMVNLTKAQRAFEATMKVITTADQMLETLLSLK